MNTDPTYEDRQGPLQAPHSHYVGTAEQCRELDRQTIDSFGISSFTLMEVAGHSAAKHLLDSVEQPSSALFLCGTGNNAGDALVAARYWIQHGHRAVIVFTGGTESLSPDTQKNLDLLEKIQHEDSTADVEFISSWESFDQNSRYSFLVDGLIGTGLNSDLRGDYLKAVGWMNGRPEPVYAMDIPTGLHADTGEVMGAAVKAAETFAFGARKQGFYLNSGYEHTGSVTYCDLPFPNYLKKSMNTSILDSSWLKQIRPGKARHKYEAGVLYIIAGSEGLTGAAVIAARSAWAEGIGAVILVTPAGNLPVYEETLPQIIKKPVGNRDDYRFGKAHLEKVLSILSEKEGCVLAGPGLGREPDTVAFIHGLMERCPNDMVIDADALWCLSQAAWSKPKPAQWILTPHPGELARLLGKTPKNGVERLHAVRTLAAKKDVTILSKGMPAIVGTSGGNCYLTGYDTRIFSRAGFGDVLAGKAGAFRAMQQSPEQSCAGALLSGYQKIEQLKQHSPDLIPEPMHLI